jgi:uncharacterized protein
MNNLSRRGFLRGSSLLAAGAGMLRERMRIWAQDPVVDTAGAVDHQSHEKVAWKAKPFPMTDVRLRSGHLKDMQERNRIYLFMLPNDRLAHNFRIMAGKPSNTQPRADGRHRTVSFADISPAGIIFQLVR